jgi:hypothetical protein
VLLDEPAPASQRHTDHTEVRCQLIRVGAALLVVALAAVLLVVACDSHAWIIGDALGQTGKGTAPDANIPTLVKHLAALATDAMWVVEPAATLGGITGGAMWAVGSQRGQGILLGSVSGGVLALSMSTILN